MERRIGEPAVAQELREFMANRTGTSAEDWFLTFRAREAMQIVFESSKDLYGKGGVLLQPFTCSTVPEAIIAADMDPVYCDISPVNLGFDLEKIKEGQLMGEGTSAVIMQHTFGLFDQEREAELAQMAAEKGVLLMEDSAHCAGKMATDADGKPMADISVHSFGVEKMIPTSYGAITYINPHMKDQKLREEIAARFASLKVIDDKVGKAVKDYRTRLRILNHLPMKVRRPLRDSWVAKKKFVPAVASVELAGGTLFDPALPDNEVILRCMFALKNLDENEGRRSHASDEYAKAFGKASEAYYVPEAAKSGNRSLLWFPIITGSQAKAKQIVAALWKKGHYSSTWGRPLLFPGVTDPEKFRFGDAEEKACSMAAKCSNGILLLPTNKTAEEVDEVIGIVSELIEGMAFGGYEIGNDAGVAVSKKESGEYIINENISFVPVLLGTETSVYNMARAFYEEYGVVSQAYGRKPLVQTAYSKFVNVRFSDDFGEPEAFVSILNEEVERYRGKNPVLISCGDNYTRLLSSVKDQIDPEYIIVCPEYENVNAVNSKYLFYQICEKAGVPYPKTVALRDANLEEVPFTYPLVLKPDDAEDYNAHPFEGQKKAFVLDSEEELRKALSDTYAAGYSGIMLMQEFIPGGDENMRVVNGYKRSDGPVALMSMGQPLLEDYYPMAIGNYNVILASGDDEVYDTVDKLLAEVPYLGYFNLDLKYDHRDGVFKVFDFNPRMGRSSYYVTLAGHNLAKCVVDDVVLHAPADPQRSYDEYVWSEVPTSIIKKYVNEGQVKDRVLALIRSGKVGGTFKKSGDNSFRRRMENMKAELRHVRNYKRYFVAKED